MKKIVPFIAIVAMILSNVCCQSPTPRGLTDADQQYLRKMMTDAQDAWNAGNRNPYIDRYASDAKFMAPNMETLEGKEAVRNFATTFPDLKATFPVLEVDGSGEFAFVHGAYTLLTQKDSLIDKGKYLSVWRRVDNNTWLLTKDMFNSDFAVAK